MTRISWAAARRLDLPTVISHGVVALSLGAWFPHHQVPRRVWAVGALCAVVPDVDVVGYQLGIAYGDVLGHRGLSHSLPFAVALATTLVALCFRRGVPGLTARGLWSYLCLATASHGLLDAFTDGGLGVALFAPFENGRYFFPVRPIEVSPLSVDRFFGKSGLAVLRSELLWVWVPSALLAGLAIAVRRRRRSLAAAA